MELIQRKLSFHVVSFGLHSQLSHAARYLQLDRQQCCFPPNLAGHACKHGYKHSEYGTAITWDDALQSTTRLFEHKTYNLFTCNCHSFAANCLNRYSFGWLAFLSWAVLIHSPPYGVVSAGHLLFQKPIRMLELLQPCCNCHGIHVDAWR
ncbi:PROTEIN REVERSION-TO-ETHYLENE SENSITIVITY1 [Salix purpurea]|uniref:PROTEIN REVERSION-TO-ETHYLENE SENSITIVITY1 n=1 Tax=Salix purpurea TaxID=77065 RepID=A0A9Q0Q146_SALPP|nr:PROTEIN REVERSION-TO-ETHYLENE SENSITIVITY1 [Salix purpurea]